MPKVVVTYQEPVVRPVKDVTITMTAEEAKIMKLICNYRSRISDEIRRATGSSFYAVEVSSLLYGTFRSLHDQGVHAKDRQ